METSFLGGGGRPHLCHPQNNLEGDRHWGLRQPRGAEHQAAGDQDSISDGGAQGGAGGAGGAATARVGTGCPPKPKGWLEDSRGPQCHRAGGCWKGLKAPW